MNTFFRLHVVVATAVLGASLALAQPASAPGPAASAPRPVMGPGKGMGMGMGPRAGAGITPGWSMMTPEEQAAHQAAMRGMKSKDECTVYRDRHHQQMVERAKARGQAMPGAPRPDVCDGLTK